MVAAYGEAALLRSKPAWRRSFEGLTPYLGGGRVFEFRNSKCRNWKLESVKVRRWEGGVMARSLSESIG